MFKKNAFGILVVLSVLFLVFALILISQAPAQAATNTPTNTTCPLISGYVRVGSTSGPGLANVQVTGVLSGSPTLTGTTDSSGYFGLSGCGRNGMVITPVLSGYTFSPATQTYTGTGQIIFVATATTNNTPTRTPTAGFTNTPTRTPTGSCVLPTAEILKVSPVTSPTSATTQVITVTLNNGVSVTVTGPAGSFTSTTPVGGVFSVTINLVTNSTNNLTVQGTVQVSPGCTYTLSKSVDTSGNPLTIVQGTVNTPTRTPTAGAGTCSPVTSTITAPFTKDGTGTFCWQSSNLGSYINSWNLSSLTINGVNETNLYVASGSYPAKISGYWYVSYTSTSASGHFEAK